MIVNYICLLYFDQSVGNLLWSENSWFRVFISIQYKGSSTVKVKIIDVLKLIYTLPTPAPG
jgi:hypothetical protein